ncbi:MAG: hypothetical protein E6I87_11945 [Chloroflexi bacterium]|nr:MAG: hypothetical protein E6I87_11945 [Chloroflexota bacterium]
MEIGKTYYARDRAAWRRWLERNHDRASEIWLINPKKASGKPRVPYNDAVEEALCFGWIDSTNKTIDAQHVAQRFTPRRKGSPLSPMNRERVRRLIAAGRMTAAGRRAIRGQLATRPTIPADIRVALKADPAAWRNFARFPASYKRIRIGWVDGARRRPDEFKKRLAYLVKMTAQNRQYGMVR